MAALAIPICMVGGAIAYSAGWDDVNPVRVPLPVSESIWRGALVGITFALVYTLWPWADWD